MGNFILLTEIRNYNAKEQFKIVINVEDITYIGIEPSGRNNLILCGGKLQLYIKETPQEVYELLSKNKKTEE